MTQYLSSEKYGCMIDPRKPIDSSFNACRMNKTNFYYAVKLLTSEYYLDDEDSFFIQRAYKNYNSPEYRDKTARLISDFTFDCDIVQYAKYISSFVKGNKYFFEYQLRSSSNPWPKWMGAMHGYEMEYFFGMPFRHFRRYRSDTFSYERSISEKLINMINNFMLTGKPYPKWDQFNEKKMNALIIDKKFCSRNTINYYDVFSDTCKVHDKILKKYPLWGRKFNNFRMKNHV
ncbi:Cholinesterase family and Carboxylesterase, type B domain-containing protein [Strongyloides ratti]|uniref:Acetylcholinesterase n=1 Tax=Strongyloides ratti TaxID=34506 RepID=A0A090KYG6_STRRB|nr:Cholinesterase family and Carboxylesterase, type B domain-containing protein [Strongyloides ratti]CEF62486.1 Cholinesterase family and Carboxylesterase, type B domain-containing protein [Strongyloides ratti]